MPTPTTTPQSKWYTSIWFVLLMLFFVVGPLGIPLLWRSPRFARWAKIALTLLVLLYTYWLIAFSITTAQSTLNKLNQLL